ncbi:hypothetical protein ACT7DN_30675 [Bacillus paranthracis]
MELLNNLNKMNGELSEEELYNLTLNVGNVGEEFATRSKILTQIKVPEKLPDDVQSSLEVVKKRFINWIYRIRRKHALFC